MRAASRLILIALFCVWAAAQAEVYTWVDDQGVRHYSDHPVSERARPADIRIPDTSESAGATRPVIQRIRVLSPKSGAHFKNANGRVEIAVEIKGQLGEHEQLVYYLDGQTVANSPTRMRQFHLAGLDAGPHALQVVLVADEREIARTEPVAFSIASSGSAKQATGTVGEPGSNAVPRSQEHKEP